MLFAYISPEAMWPVMSVIAGAVGTFLMFGRNVVAYGRRMVRNVLPGPKRSRVTSPSPSDVNAGANAGPDQA